MGLRINYNVLENAQASVSDSVKDDVIYYFCGTPLGNTIAARSISNDEGAVLHVVKNLERNPDELSYWEFRQMFNRDNQVDRILPWLAKTVRADTKEHGLVELVIRHVPDYIGIVKRSDRPYSSE